ncbi:MAG TPA: hypothetical protein VFM09_04770 [Marmoricola sp.]|nr:hypothetical protein [Marmoricola sp.]
MLIRPALVAATAAALTLLPLGVANAQTYRHVDAAHDVQTGTFNSNDTFPPPLAPAPTQADPDIRKVKIKYGQDQLSVRVHFGDLTRTQKAISIYGVMIRTSEHKRRELDLLAGPGHWKGQAELLAPHPCRGLRHHISYRLHDVVMRVPASCLGNPGWVKVAGISVKETLDMPAPGTDPTDANVTLFLDDALSDKASFTTMHWTPRIHRH